MCVPTQRWLARDGYEPILKKSLLVDVLEAQAQPNRTSTLPPARPAALQPADRMRACLLKEDFQQLWEA